MLIFRTTSGSQTKGVPLLLLPNPERASACRQACRMSRLPVLSFFHLSFCEAPVRELHELPKSSGAWTIRRGSQRKEWRPARAEEAGVWVGRREQGSLGTGEERATLSDSVAAGTAECLSSVKTLCPSSVMTLCPPSVKTLSVSSH